MAKLLATGIRKFPHLSAFDDLARERMAALELERALVYLIDTVPADVLPFLAEQFDVLGYKGWGLIDITPTTKLVFFPGGGSQGVALDNVTAANEVTGQISVLVTATVPAASDALLWGKLPTDEWAGEWVFCINSDGTLSFCWSHPDGRYLNYTTTETVNAGEKIRYGVELVPDTTSYTIRFFVDELAGNGLTDVEDNTGSYTTSAVPSEEYPGHHLGGNYYLAEIRNAANELRMLFDPNQTFEADDNWFASTGEGYALFGGAAVVIEGNTPEEVTAQRRELLKRALELHRYKGTPYSVKEAIRSVGFRDARVIEKVGIRYDASISHDGSQTYGSGFPFNFRVVFDLGNQQGITAKRLADLTALIEEYKNVRSRLVNIAFEATLEERAFATDDVELEIEFVGLDEAALREVRYNAEHTYNGGVQYDSTTDSLSTDI